MLRRIILVAHAPLYGRAREILELPPLAPSCLTEAFGVSPGRELVELYAAWGGVPRYWELAAEVEGGVSAQIERMVLDPLGPLHNEPDRILLEEIPPAVELRPLLGGSRGAGLGGPLPEPDLPAL